MEGGDKAKNKKDESLESDKNSSENEEKYVQSFRDTKELNKFFKNFTRQKLDFFYEKADCDSNIDDLVKESISKLGSFSNEVHNSKSIYEKAVATHDYLKENFEDFEVYKKKLNEIGLTSLEKAAVFEFTKYYAENKKEELIAKIPNQIKKIKKDFKSALNENSFSLFFKYAQIRSYSEKNLAKLYEEFQEVMLDCILEIPIEKRDVINVYSFFNKNWLKVKKLIKTEDSELINQINKLKSLEKKYNLNNDLEQIADEFKHIEIRKINYKPINDDTTSLYKSERAQ